MLHVTGNIITTQWPIMNGTHGDPALTFSGARGSGIAYASPNNINFHVSESTPLIVHANGAAIQGTIIATKLVGNGALLNLIPSIHISNVQIVDSNNELIDDTALDSSNTSYLRINGNGFGIGTTVLIGNTLASAVTMTSTTSLFATIPPKPTGTYDVSVVRVDGISATLPLAASFSPFPVWTTASTLPDVTKTVAFSKSLVATDPLGGNVTYAIAPGSIFPSNVTLTTNGILSGNITSDPGNSTTYTFTINAIDSQYQDIPRTFSLTAITSIVATGGTVTFADGYKIHTFTTSDTFIITTNQLARPVEYLVVGGGGGGGGATGGGGGGGGVLYGTSNVSVGAYSIVVGSGGAGGANARGSNGQDSSFNSNIAIGGGGGGGYNVANAPGSDGGCGGGAMGGPAYLPGKGSQGFRGGYSTSWSGFYGTGGGGGGGAVGGDGTTAAAGNGGIGYVSSISGTSTYYAGGGGGGTYNGGTLGSGGLGGGGNATSAGTTNTGGGGGGQKNDLATAAGAGGSGIVILRYLVS